MIFTAAAFAVWIITNFIISFIYSSDHMIMNDNRLFILSTGAGILLLCLNLPWLLVLTMCFTSTIKFVYAILILFTIPPAPNNAALSAKPVAIEIMRLVSAVICLILLTV